jgi:DNA-binding Xre family transcriptional regulator
MDALGIRGYRALAQRTSGGLSHGSVHRIMTGRQTSIRPHTLEALAVALGSATADLLAAAGVDRSPWTLPEAFDGVNVTVRPAVERALAQLLEAGGIL